MSRKLTEEEIQNLVECFESLGVVPDTTHFLPTLKILTFAGEGDQKDAAFESLNYDIQTLLPEEFIF